MLLITRTVPGPAFATAVASAPRTWLRSARPSASGGGTHREHDHLGAPHSRCRAPAQRQRLAGEDRLQQLVEQRLVDGSPSLADQLETIAINVEEPDHNAAVRETHSGDEADIPGTDDADGIGTPFPLPCPLSRHAYKGT